MLEIYVLAAIVLRALGEKMDPAFAVEYFSQRNVKQIVVFACWKQADRFDFSREIISRNTRLSYTAIADNLDMQRILKFNYYKLGVILDLDCPRSHIIFEQVSAARLPFNDSYNWLSVTMASEVAIVIIRDLPLTVESELTVALIQKPTYSLYDVYNHGYRHGGKINVTFMGYWDKKGGLKNHLTQYKYERRRDFYGLTLNFSLALLNNPVPDLESYLRNPINPHLDSMTRFHYALVLQLQNMYNFTINMKRAPTWGYLVNGTFNGILGDMMNGIVDISASPFQYLMERLDACEFTVETYVVKTSFIFRHPKRSNVRNPFLKPLAPNVWLLVISFSITCWILLLISVKLEDYVNSSKNIQLYACPSTETALITFAAISQQGLSEGPHLYSGRITFITLFLGALLIYQFYSASIVGSLITAPPKFIKNLIDLGNSELHVAYEDTPYIHAYWRSPSNPDSLYLKKKKMITSQKKKTFTDALDGLQQVSKGDYAFFIDSATGYKIIEDTFAQYQICELAEINLITPRPVTIVTSKKSPFKKMAIYGLRKIVQSGLIPRLYRIWHHRRPTCPESFRSQPVPVELQEFSPAIFLIAGGLVLSALAMAAERAASSSARCPLRCWGAERPAGTGTTTTTWRKAAHRRNAKCEAEPRALQPPLVEAVLGIYANDEQWYILLSGILSGTYGLFVRLYIMYASIFFRARSGPT